jgi:hypothetical protein
MLANGRCQAPEAVALSRSLGGDLVPSDLRSGYPPAVRFYFSWRTLAGRAPWSGGSRSVTLGLSGRG